MPLTPGRSRCKLWYITWPVETAWHEEERFPPSERIHIAQQRQLHGAGAHGFARPCPRSHKVFNSVQLTSRAIPRRVRKLIARVCKRFVLAPRSHCGAHVFLHANSAWALSPVHGYSTRAFAPVHEQVCPQCTTAAGSNVLHRELRIAQGVIEAGQGRREGQSAPLADPVH